MERNKNCLLVFEYLQFLYKIMMNILIYLIYLYIFNIYKMKHFMIVRKLFEIIYLLLQIYRFICLNTSWWQVNPSEQIQPKYDFFPVT